MGALNPLFLLAGLTLAVPIYLHLFHRHQTRRLSFPALRYLERTEREHARQIRLRQILLMLARVMVLALLVGAGARLFFSGRGASHPPTAVVIILDNSMSSGLVIGEIRVLDELKSLARQTLGAATDEDRFWLIRAGEPWMPAIPGNSADAASAVDATEASEAAGDLTAALQRAVRLLANSGLENGEIHLLSDLQSSAFVVPGAAPADSVPVVAWTGHEETSPNRALSGVVVGGGLPPLEGQRTSVTVTAMEATTQADSTHVPVRLVVNERIRGAATLPAGAQTTIAMPPTDAGWVQGYVDADPDDLRADDRRYFAYRSRPAPTVAVGGDPGVFVSEALAVLEGANRVRRAAPERAALLISSNGTALEQRASSGAALIIPPVDATRLPALNRRLADAGIPWRFDQSPSSGESDLMGTNLPIALDGVRVRSRYRLRLIADPPAPTRTLAEIQGQPWAVEGTDASGRRYLVVASAMDAGGSTLPISTGLLRFVDWVSSEWAGAGGGVGELLTGSQLAAPAGATHVRFPGGADAEIDGTRMVRGTGTAGFYTFLRADTVVAIVSLNPPPRESRLTSLAGDDFGTAIGSAVVDANRAAGWDRVIYRVRQGPELWWPFLLAVLALLLLEALMATSGGRNPLSSRGGTHESGPSDGVRAE
jgi:aerotolerance regulator-like protein